MFCKLTHFLFAPPAFLLPFLSLLFLWRFRFAHSAAGSPSAGGVAAGAITPIPMELLNPRLTEFRRIDASGDDQITFSEFLLSDRPWMETMSRRYHSIDANSDGKVTRKEFETFFRGKDEEQERQQQRNHQQQQPDSFFKQLTVTVGPIVEREQEGDAQNGSHRMRYFTAGSRKYAAITHGTGLFPASSAASSSLSSSSAELPSSSLVHDFDHHHFHNPFPHHAQFLLPASAAILGGGGSSSSQPSQRGRGAQVVEQQQQLTPAGGPAAQSAVQREQRSNKM